MELLCGFRHALPVICDSVFSMELRHDFISRVQLFHCATDNNLYGLNNLTC